MTQIVRRDIEFGVSNERLPRDWYAGDPQLTPIVGALSLMFPRGESFFVESVRRFRDRIDDPALAADVVGFVGQEAMHGREHRAFNELLAQRAPEAVARIDRHVKFLLGGARKFLSPRGQLAVTCALEHYTATLAEHLLEPGGLGESIHPAAQPMWLWHGFEELEHRAVAFDVYRAVGGGYFRRAALMLVTGAIFAVALVRTSRWLRAADPRPRTWRDRARTVGHLFGRPGPMRRLISATAGYMIPWFHPNRRDVAAVLDRSRTALFDADAGLTVRGAA